MALPTVNFVAANTVIPRKSYVRLIPNPTGVLVAASGATATNIITLASHGFLDGQAVKVSVITGLSGVTTGTVYYVRDSLSGSFKITTTVGGTALALGSDGTASVRKVADLIGKTLNYKQTLEKISREIPDADGLLRPDRTVAIKRLQDFGFETEEIAALPAAFGQTDDASGNLTAGTAQCYVVDPDDAAGKAAIVTNEFAATWNLDSDLNFEAGKTTVAKLMINSLEKVQLKIDGTV